jgi:NADH dehydrogenase
LKTKSQHIVIIGGGAGGLELVARLCRQFKKNKSIKITLIDSQLKHVWKPLLHQVAAGTYASYQDEIDYFTFAYQKGFNFIFGLVQDLDRVNKSIYIQYLNKVENDFQPSGIKINYDLLVIAIGSQSNNFGIPGVKEHCLLLDSLYEAEDFNKLFTKQLIKIAQPTEEVSKIEIAIVGGGATGIELAAELNHVLLEASKYQTLKSPPFKITIIEAAHRVLSNMPERISKTITNYLGDNKIDLLTDTKITGVSHDGLSTADGKFIKAQMVVWAAGVRANQLSSLDGLEINKINQLVVTNTLQTTKDESIFAFGDCASCPQTDRLGKSYYVPPRAQASHQQAKLLAKSLKNYLMQKPLLRYRYIDYGSLITLSRYNVVGNLMTKIAKNFYIEGWLAQFAYWLLYKKHLMILKGIRYVVLSTIADFIIKKQRPEIKLH